MNIFFLLHHYNNRRYQHLYTFFFFNHSLSLSLSLHIYSSFQHIRQLLYLHNFFHQEETANIIRKHWEKCSPVG
ncbi:hypothetical protein BKA57DRAFT_537553 [Linnemannia elongata]|nr:hypothetical protein BKA57DRAFT_537553 [Linnemannia elongata]